MWFQNWKMLLYFLPKKRLKTFRFRLRREFIFKLDFQIHIWLFSDVESNVQKPKREIVPKNVPDFEELYKKAEADKKMRTEELKRMHERETKNSKANQVLQTKLQEMNTTKSVFSLIG